MSSDGVQFSTGYVRSLSTIKCMPLISETPCILIISREETSPLEVRVKQHKNDVEITSNDFHRLAFGAEIDIDKVK
ncbi:hypothetical protein NQ315_002078 [Exocentrus adspersus]|uniref:Uncharacterized protein n=1 Tax=Exocentrus adspersus TaxID=1586481 RepID=A0AAV8V9E9_9CUCU|nr:hypothetical protein NQ315_002078 [Exocentrus adspersus]